MTLRAPLKELSVGHADRLNIFNLFFPDRVWKLIAAEQLWFRRMPMTVRADSADRAARVVRVRDVLAPFGRLRAVCFKTVNDKRTAARDGAWIILGPMSENTMERPRDHRTSHHTAVHDNNIMPPPRTCVCTTPETRVGKVVVLRTDGRTTATVMPANATADAVPDVFFRCLRWPLFKILSLFSSSPPRGSCPRASRRPPRRRFSADGFPRTRARTISTFHHGSLFCFAFPYPAPATAIPLLLLSLFFSQN